MRNIVRASIRLYTVNPLFYFSISKIRTPVLPIISSIIPRACFSTAKPPAEPHLNISKGEFEGPGFYMEQMMTGCLSIYSYYIESGNECFLIDPLNQTDKYDALIKQRGKTLKGVFLTHYHADYIAGHLEIKKKYNCEIYLGPKALDTFGIKVMKDDEVIKVGNIGLRVLHTPGHTEESSCLVLVDANKKEQAIFTGDTIFLNEVGRPDLAVKTNLTAEDLAKMLYDSIQKVKKLDDNIRIYPGHGAGSACGKSIGKGDFCSLGTQKQNNYALKQLSKQQFVTDVLKEMPKPPQYFGFNAGINKFKPFDYNEAHGKANVKLTGSQVKDIISKEKVVIIDSRSKADVKAGMIKGAIAIDFDGAFVNWVGTLVVPGTAFVVYGPEARAKDSVERLLRIGYTNCKGYFSQPLQSVSPSLQTYKPDCTPSIYTENRTILDIRKPSQWQNGIAQGNVKLLQLNDQFENNIKKLDKSVKYVVHCQSGYRARIGYSIMKNQGFDVKVFVDGGFADFEKLGVKVVKPSFG